MHIHSNDSNFFYFCFLIHWRNFFFKIYSLHTGDVILWLAASGWESIKQKKWMIFSVICIYSSFFFGYYFEIKMSEMKSIWMNWVPSFKIIRMLWIRTVVSIWVSNSRYFDVNFQIKSLHQSDSIQPAAFASIALFNMVNAFGFQRLFEIMYCEATMFDVMFV